MRKSLKSLALAILAVCILAGFYLLPSDTLKSEPGNSPLYNSSLKETKERLVTGRVPKTQVGIPKNFLSDRQTTEVTCDWTCEVTCDWTCFSTCGQPTCSGSTCEGSCEYSCDVTWCGYSCTIPTCEGPTCPSTCEGPTCQQPTCVGGETCEGTCAGDPTCDATCGYTCAGITCAATCASTCAATCAATCASTCTGPGCSFPNLNIIMTPINPPITIPATGGSFTFKITLQNLEMTPQVFDAWSMVEIPYQGWVGPFLAQRNFELAAQDTVEFYRNQTVPARVPHGTYLYWGYIGHYPDDRWDSSMFVFVKLSGSGLTGGGEIPMLDWFCSEANLTEPLGTLPESDHAQQIHADAYPNPFNPMTSIHFTLAQPASVTLQIFDINGKTVASPLQNQQLEAGEQSVLFDGSSLPTGIYIYRLQAGKYQASGKIILLK